MSTNPFVFDVSDVLGGDGTRETVTQTGPSPSRIGPEMIAIPEGREVEIEATLVPLGSGVMVDATATAQLEGQCVRCLKELTPTETLRISEVFSASDDFITGDSEEDEDQGSGDEIRQVVDGTVDIEQAFVDEATAESNRLRSECDDYVDSKLAEFEDGLRGVLQTVSSDRSALRRGAGAAGAAARGRRDEY